MSITAPKLWHVKVDNTTYDAPVYLVTLPGLFGSTDVYAPSHFMIGDINRVCAWIAQKHVELYGDRRYRGQYNARESFRSR